MNNDKEYGWVILLAILTSAIIMMLAICGGVEFVRMVWAAVN